MRFAEFIQEHIDFDAEKFKQECAPYFEAIDKPTRIMFHGDAGGAKDISIVDFKPRNKPKSTLKEIHNEINKYLEERFGWPFRNGLFVTGSENQAAEFGKPFAIIPIGKFEWLCNTQIRDFTWDYSDSWTALTKNPLDNFLKEKRYSWIHNTNLSECIQSRKEIMLKCEKFYQIEMNTYDKIIKEYL